MLRPSGIKTSVGVTCVLLYGCTRVSGERFKAADTGSRGHCSQRQAWKLTNRPGGRAHVPVRSGMRRSMLRQVYNLEVQTERAYLVGSFSAHAHNASETPSNEKRKNAGE